MNIYAPLIYAMVVQPLVNTSLHYNIHLWHMKPSKVLRRLLNLHEFRLTMYQIAKASGLTPSAITRIVDETYKDVGHRTIINISHGLHKLHPDLRAMFHGLLIADDENDRNTLPNQPLIDPAEDPIVIAKVIEKLVNEIPEIKTAIEIKREQLNRLCYPDLEVVLSLQMQKERREE